MRRSVLWGAGMLFLAVVWVRLALPPDVAAASSGKIIYSFGGGADGAYPYSDLVLDSAGNLYGTTYLGGTGCNTAGCGTVFELIRTGNGWKHQVLYSFAGAPNDGFWPLAGLVFDSSGNLYGTTAFGGSNCSNNGGCGTAFKLTPNSQGGWSESVIFNFTGTNRDGQFPNTDLVIDSQGNLYGTAGGGTGTGFCGGFNWRIWSTPPGCGIAFKLTPGSGGAWTETTIYDFGGAPDASFPVGPLVLNADGGIYGAAAFGGAGPCFVNSGGPPAGCGALYKLAPSGGGWTETVLYSFFRGLGTAKNPAGGVIVDKPGVLLGTSSQGGDGGGTFFRVEQTAKGWEQDVLHRFFYVPDGWRVVGHLANGPNSNLFGTTAGGGSTSSSGGTVFELERTEQGWKERVLFSFDRSFAPLVSGPTVDPQGRVYGTALDGGSAGAGAVYEVIP